MEAIPKKTVVKTTKNKEENEYMNLAWVGGMTGQNSTLILAKYQIFDIGCVRFESIQTQEGGELCWQIFVSFCKQAEDLFGQGVCSEFRNGTAADISRKRKQIQNRIFTWKHLQPN